MGTQQTVKAAQTVNGAADNRGFLFSALFLNGRRPVVERGGRDADCGMRAEKPKTGKRLLFDFPARPGER